MQIVKTDKQLPGKAIAYPGYSKAIEVRREMAKLPEVMDALNNAEKMIFLATTKDPIADMETKELCTKSGTLAKFVSRDAGIKQIDEYDVTRFVDILQRYYSSLTLAEVKLAFEFAMAGELDSYLPRDRDGNPDKNHYQAFSVEYVTKILNAFRKKKFEVESKAYDAIPQIIGPTDRQKEYYLKFVKDQAINIYLSYKYTGKIGEKCEERIIYQVLEKLGLAEPVCVTKDDKKKAMNNLLRKAQSGIIKPFVAECIRRIGTNHEAVIDSAYYLARSRAIRKSLDLIIKEEIQLIELIR